MDDWQRVWSRRRLLAAGAAGTAALVADRLFGQADTAARPAQPPVDLVFRNPRPLDAEAPLTALDSYRTPPESFFVRSHFGAPTPIPLDWTLVIDGEVKRPMRISLDEIRRMGGATRYVTTECAGNGRALFRLPNTSGVQWERGGVSNANWTGVPLGALLERASLKPSARHLWMEALDHAPLPTVPRFLRSIPRDVALGDVFVAYEMNGKAIPLLHGGPLRLIVPGWFGMASTKWLTHIHARPDQSDNFFMAHGYRYSDTRPVQEMRVKSVIAHPLQGQRVSAGSVRVSGQAWSGAGSGGIRKVEISTNGGRRWAPAKLTDLDQPGAWRSWQAQLTVDHPGAQSVMARATDRRGEVQPMHAAPNPGGYGNNSIHEVSFDVARS